MSTWKLIALAAAATALSTSANADPTLSFGALGKLSASETLFANYDDVNPLPSGGLLQISPAAGIPGVAAPVGSGNFAYAVGGSNVSYSFASPSTSFSLDVGSPDTYNFIGLSLASGAVDYFQNFTGDAARYIFTATNPADYIVGVTLGSDQNSLEFDNLAIASVSAAPEPGVWMMMILGFGLIGGVMRSAYRKSEENFTRKVRSLATA